MAVRVGAVYVGAMPRDDNSGQRYSVLSMVLENL